MNGRAPFSHQTKHTAQSLQTNEWNAPGGGIGYGLPLILGGDGRPRLHACANRFGCVGWGGKKEVKGE